jgi:signal transduction histidine kinase
MEAVDLAKVVQEVRLDLAPQMDAAQAVLKVTLDACPTILFSEKNLRSVVYNLLSNAIKYGSSERTPVVKIASHQEGCYSVLSFSDNGLGMDLSRQTKLFTMFGRLHNHVEGSGVGLYMVKKMVENAGGKIEVASQVGIGSTFRIYFPMEPVSSPSIL